MEAPKPSQKQIDELRDLVDRYNAHRDFYVSSSKGYNEHSCRDDFINPLLSILGWDVGNLKGIAPQYREVIAENYSSESERPDYTLVVGGTPLFFVEAKKPSVNIIEDSEPSLQARKYGWNAKHNIAVLTNFEDLVIFDTSFMPTNSDTPNTARYRRYSHEDYVDKFEEIYALLSRESAYNGYFSELVNTEFQSISSGKERVDEVFLNQINEWRLSLATSLLSKSSKYKNQELLNDAVQDFINQIVFLRVCEDKNLPVYHKLSELDKSDVLDSMIELLKKADRKYNSGLFSQTSAISDLDDDSVIQVIQDLYYPQSPYLFDIIDSNLFGQIYEMFLSQRIEIDTDGKPYLARKREYKDRSVVATPAEIARYIVTITLGPLCDEKTPEEIKDIRCADIACGSGIFLIEAYQYLLNKCLEWQYENDPSKLIPLGDGRYKLSLADKKDILSSCIFGIDIDAHAVEVAKFSLLIKLIEDESAASVEAVVPILPNLDENIVVGNSLVSPEEASQAGATSDEKKQIIPFDWRLINRGKPFDAIFGNPPYVKTEDLHNLLPEAEMKAYKENYDSAYKQFDKYYIFMEQALGHLRSGGYAGFIVPNKFFKIASGQKLREIITRGQFLVSIHDFGDAQLFEDKTIYSSIICLQKAAHKTFNYTPVAKAQDLWVDNDLDTVVLGSNDIDAKPWRLTTDLTFLKALNDMEDKSVPLTNHVEIFNGIQTSAEQKKSYWFLRDEIIEEDRDTYTFKRNGVAHKIEKSILRPFFKPTEDHGFNTYSQLQYDKLLIFPYKIDGSLIPENEMMKEYPNAWKYLLSVKDELWPKQLPGDGRRDVPSATLNTWYQYGRTQALTSFNNREKIIVGILSEQPLYYIDTDDWIIASGGTAGYCAIAMKPESPYALEYIQAWLTNESTEKIFEMIGSDFEGGFKSRGTSLLKTLRFVEPDLNDDKQRAKYEEVIALSRRIRDINDELKGSTTRRVETVLLREKEEAIGRVSTLISDAFFLKDAK